ncbi:MAG: hypothetical protein E7385_07710 [Ruminococcaceae bacterium]|nr:hypothetical protein [Oscillospiraceae bacterium]
MNETVECRDFCIAISKSLDEYYNRIYDRQLNPNYDEEFISTGFYDQDMLSENEREARWQDEYYEAFAMTNGQYIRLITEKWDINEVKQAVEMFVDQLPSNIPSFLYDLVADKIDAKEYFQSLYEDRKRSLSVDTYSNDIDKQDIINTDGIIKLVELFTNMKLDYFDIALDILDNLNVKNDSVIETTVDYMCKIRPEKVFELLRDDYFDDYAKHIALTLLAETEYKTEELYQMLRTMFKNAQTTGEKLNMFFVLGTYGNPRAIPMMKKFIKDVYGERIKPPEDQQERNTLLTLFNIITDLGGNVQDLIS